MNAQEFQYMLSDALFNEGENRTELTDMDVRTFSDSGLMTRDKGLVVKLADGSEFQVTVVQSVFGDDDEDED